MRMRVHTSIRLRVTVRRDFNAPAYACTSAVWWQRSSMRKLYTEHLCISKQIGGYADP